MYQLVTSAEISRRLLARGLDAPIHRVRWVLQTRKSSIPPTGVAGAVFVYAEESVQAVARVLAGIDSRKVVLA